MKAISSEWVRKAEGDFLTAQREMKASPANYDAVCFHAQQCAEKYIKARLVEAGIEFPKTHDLSALLNRILPIEPGWEVLRESLDRLSALGVEVRYPGLFVDAHDASEALRTAENVRSLGRSSLGVEE
ncbi:MAG: HEPN domain-containing protein [bacterium]